MHQQDQPDVDGTGVNEQFGEMIRNARSDLNWSQRGLARALEGNGLKLDPSAITRIETGQREPKLREAVALAELLNLNLTELNFVDDSVVRRELSVINTRLVESRKAILQALSAIDRVLDSSNERTEKLRRERFGRTTEELIRQQIWQFYDMVDHDRQRSSPNHVEFVGEADLAIKQYLVDALVYKILRPTVDESASDNPAVTDDSPEA